MASHVAFLRGMNVGGRRVKNEELRAVFAGLGLDDVATFRASGNVIFDAGDGANEAALARRIEDALGDALGYAVPVFLRDASELRAIAERRPFPDSAVAGSAGKLQVVLLAAPPPDAARREALALATDADRLAVEGRELYWLPNGGISDSELDLGRIAELLGQATVRTKGTIDLIAGKHFAAERR